MALLGKEITHVFYDEPIHISIPFGRPLLSMPPVGKITYKAAQPDNLCSETPLPAAPPLFSVPSSGSTRIDGSLITSGTITADKLSILADDLLQMPTRQMTVRVTNWTIYDEEGAPATDIDTWEKLLEKAGMSEEELAAQTEEDQRTQDELNQLPNFGMF